MQNDFMKQAVMKHAEKVQPPFDVIIEQNGYEAVCFFCDMLGGTTFYVPSKQTVFKKCFEEEARKEYDGTNFREIQRKYGYSNSHLRNILNNKS